MNKRALGGRYEQMAKAYLEENGYQIIAQNYRCKVGEIDLIGLNDGYLCFIEVKYRAGQAYGDPLEAVTAYKQRTIYRVAQAFLMGRGFSQDQKCRFDVVGITPGQIHLVKNAF